ncbi:MAG: hypothetical protein ABIK89_23415 [Planctomycetota bacterium]
MARYQVSIIETPEGWEPASPDDVPPEPGSPREVLAEADDLFEAVRQAIAHNESPERKNQRSWAVVSEPGSLGRVWRGARLCTPLGYKVTAIWWPSGWEPDSPLDVPNCVWKAQGGSGQEPTMTYQRALATVEGLNRQSMDQAGAMWYVVIAVENEPVSHTVSYDPSGTETTVEVRRLHVVRPEEGGGKGDCSHCPAHAFDCAKQEWTALEQTATDSRTRSLPIQP